MRQAFSKIRYSFTVASLAVSLAALCASPAAAGLSDLVVHNITMNSACQTIVTIGNAGDTALPAGTRIEVRIQRVQDGRGAGGWTAPFVLRQPLAPKAQLSSGGSVQLISGTMEVRAEVDPNRKIPETNENNNRLIRTFTCAGSADLTAEIVSVGPNPAVGAPIAVQARIRNVGTAAMPWPAKVAARLYRIDARGRRDRRSVVEKIVPLAVVSPSGQRLISVQLQPKEQQPGRYEVRVEADSAKRIDETNERNNSARTVVEVR